MKKFNEKPGIDLFLDYYAEEAVPDNVDLWPAIQSSITAKQLGRRQRILLKPWLAWIVMPAVILVLVGAGAYATVPLVPRLFQQVFTWRENIEKEGLATELNLSQTIDGFTVTLEKVYADANQIIIGYTFNTPSGQKPDPAFNYRTMALTDDRDTVFPVSGPLLTAGGVSDMLGGSLPPGAGAQVVTFDASAVQGAPDMLNLRLTMHLADAVYTTPTDCDYPAGPVQYGPAATNIPCPNPLAGPFSFEFGVPFIPGKVVEMQETKRIEEANLSLTLERVVITPSETRAVIRFDTADATNLWGLDMGLQTPTKRNWVYETGKGWIPSKDNEIKPSYISPASSNGDRNFSFQVHLDDQQPGEWTLTVHELVGECLERQQLEPMVFRCLEYEQIAGPWVFQFEVP